MLRLVAIFAIVNVALALHLKIWDGDDTDISDHPWTVSLQSSNVSFCGGTLISSTWVMTAANCVSGINLNGTDLKIRANSSRSGRGGILKEVSNVIVHPQYNFITKENDIALLQLKTAVESAKVASLPNAEEKLAEGTAVNVVGWGVAETSTGGILQLAQLQVINRNTCANQYLDTSVAVPDTKICATGDGKDVCAGDYGGPVSVTNVVYGVISPGIGCQAEFPTLFTKVSKYRSWIKQISGI